MTERIQTLPSRPAWFVVDIEAQDGTVLRLRVRGLLPDDAEWEAIDQAWREHGVEARRVRTAKGRHVHRCCVDDEEHEPPERQWHEPDAIVGLGLDYTEVGRFSVGPNGRARITIRVEEES